MKLKLTVVTPEKKVLETEAEEVQLPGERGYLGILPGHAALITLLKTGILSYRDGASAGALAISAGFAEVLNDLVTVLADLADDAGEIDVAAAQAERAKAEEEMKTAGADTLDAIRGRLELSEARLAVANKAGG
jgi:F-type H+-transporting ATPase subunit epsilon